MDGSWTCTGASGECRRRGRRQHWCRRRRTRRHWTFDAFDFWIAAVSTPHQRRDATGGRPRIDAPDATDVGIAREGRILDGIPDAVVGPGLAVLCEDVRVGGDGGLGGGLVVAVRKDGERRRAVELRIRQLKGLLVVRHELGLRVVPRPAAPVGDEVGRDRPVVQPRQAVAEHLRLGQRGEVEVRVEPDDVRGRGASAVRRIAEPRDDLRDCRHYEVADPPSRGVEDALSS